MRTEERDLHHDYAEQRAGTNEHAAIDQARAAISSDRTQIGQDRSAMHTDAASIRADQRNVATDRAQMAQDHSAIHTDVNDIRTDRGNIRTDERNVAQNQAAMRTDVNNIRTDRQDLRSDRQDLRSDAADFHGAKSERDTANRAHRNHASACKSQDHAFGEHAGKQRGRKQQEDPNASRTRTRRGTTGSGSSDGPARTRAGPSLAPAAARQFPACPLTCHTQAEAAPRRDADGFGNRGPLHLDHGTCRGLGRAVATALAAEGVDVVAVARLWRLVSVGDGCCRPRA